MKLQMDIKNHIQTLVEEKLKETEGFLVDVQIQPHKILVLIDTVKGITIKECAVISRYVESHLETTDLLEKYELEVSSPGIDRPLKVFQQYEKTIGRKIKVTTSSGEQQTGTLVKVQQEGIELKNEESNFIPFSEIKQTKIVLSF